MVDGGQEDLRAYRLSLRSISLQTSGNRLLEPALHWGMFWVLMRAL